MKKTSLADQIASLLTTTPDNLDPEDDFGDETKAILNGDFSDKSDEEVGQSQYRKQNVDLLADTDERYAGKSGSRNQLYPQDDSSGSDIESESSDEKSESDENISDNGENELGHSGDDSNFEESDEENQNNSCSQELEGTTKFTNLTDSSSHVKKGTCVKNQMNIWENLLEMRIQMQKCLVASNKLPDYKTCKKLRGEFGPEYTGHVQKTKASLSTLLNKLLLLQNLVWKKYPEIKKFQLKKRTVDDPEDEEIPSESEDENENNEEVEESEETPKKRLKISEFENDIQNKHTFYKDYRNSVIQKWHDKTRIHIMKNNANGHSIINHIEHTLVDKEKLVKRTRIKRSNYKIIGEDSGDSGNEDNLEKTKAESNPEIFDDDDFYHQLLRELIEFKSSDVTDPVQLGRQWIHLQNLRSKMKRKVDTRATKGRKIRYTVHTKLVNFMAPIDNNLWTEEAKTELFGSLFGKTQAAT